MPSQMLQRCTSPYLTHPAGSGRQDEDPNCRRFSKNQKEVQANTQADAIAPHLLLRRRTETELYSISQQLL